MSLVKNVLNAIISFQICWVPILLAKESEKRAPASSMEQAKLDLLSVIDEAKKKYPDMVILNTNKQVIAIPQLTASYKSGDSLYLRFPSLTTYNMQITPTADQAGGMRISISALDANFNRSKIGGTTIRFDPKRSASENIYEMRATLKAFGAQLNAAMDANNKASREVAKEDLGNIIGIAVLTICACLGWYAGLVFVGSICKDFCVMLYSFLSALALGAFLISDNSQNQTIALAI